jgi:hypothetical protein
MPMSSSVERIFGVGVVAKRACGNETIDSQHGTGVAERSHSCTEGYHPKEKIFAVNYPHILFIRYVRWLHNTKQYNMT